MQFPEVMRRGRFSFDTKIEYAGRLVGISERSVENETPDLALLRLEFEIFAINEQPRQLISTACIASRDIIVHANAKLDKKIKEYSRLLGVTDVNSKVSWYALERPASEAPKWIRIRFGLPNEEDMRQPFKTIGGLESVDQFEIIQQESDIFHRTLFIKVSEVAMLLRKNNVINKNKDKDKDKDKNKNPSVDTVVRFVNRFEKTYGKKLVKWEGKQRRINWYLCWHLWEAHKVR